MSMPALACVLGSPVSHSLSPFIHNRWLRMTGVSGHYVAIDPEPCGFKGALKALATLSFAGANVTAPWKAAAFREAESMSDEARSLEAANLLVRRGTAFHAHNTDVEGVREALRAPLASSSSSRPEGALILGAGGAAGAVIQALSDLAVGEVRLANRTLSKADGLASRFHRGVRVVPWEERDRAAREVGVVVNATTGDRSLLNFSETHQDVLAFDLSYGVKRGPFLADADHVGRPVLDGLTMLIAQARPSFEILFERRAPEDPTLEDDIRAMLAERL